MNLTDYLLIVTIVLSAIVGAARGFLREAVAVAAWVIALFLAWHFSDLIAPHLGGLMSDSEVRPWAARVIIVLLVLLLGAGVGAALAHFVRLSIFSGMDRLLGFGFGVLRGFVLLGVFVILGQLLRLQEEQWWRHSMLIPYGESIAHGQWPGARRVPAASHARAQRQRRHRPRALPDGGLRRRLRSAAVLRQCALRHLPWAQRQSHQRDGARRDPDPRGPAPPQHHLRLGGAAERVRFRAAAGRDRAHHARGRLCRPERPVPPLPRRLCRGRDDHRPRHTRLSGSERHPPAGAR